MPKEPPSTMSLANLLVCWVCSSRHDLRESVVDKSWANWTSLDVYDVIEKNDDLRRHLEIGIGGTHHQAAPINAIVDLFWDNPPCPSNRYINAVWAALLATKEKEATEK